MSSNRSVEKSLLWLTFLESFGTVLLERAVYFFTHDALGFDETDNLWLAFAFGVTYVAGALSSHRVSYVLGEKRALVLSLLVLLLLHTGLAALPHKTLLVLAFPTIGLLQGAKWPVIESFMSAGRTPSELVQKLSRFNTTWAIAVPLAMAASGPLIAAAPASMFGIAAAINLAGVYLSLQLPARPVHLDVAHPERPNPAEAATLVALLRSARWCMLASYALLFLLAPLMPQIFERLGVAVEWATSAAGLLDVARVAAFAWLGWWTGWRGKTTPLVLALCLLPISFFTILYGQHLGVVVAGELLFGLAAGITYTAALYYALVVKNASVDAGGAHEGLVGLGFALGPLAGIGAHMTQSWFDGSVSAMVVNVAPLIFVCTVLGLRPLRSRA